MLWIVPSAVAAPVSYVFSPGTSLQFADGNLETASGGFTIDIDTDTVSEASLVLVGADPENGIYDLVFPNISFLADNAIGFTNGSEVISMTFSGVLNGQSRSIADADYIDFTQIGSRVFLAQNGAAGQILPAPEPATLATFGLGLASLGFTTRRKQARRSKPVRKFATAVYPPILQAQTLPLQPCNRATAGPC